jgi:hypothetical protein
MSEPRKCFYIDPGQDPGEHGYIPSLVEEGIAGHSPLKGSGRFATPWYWGKDYEQACKIADQENWRVYHLTPGEAAEIVLSSMVASGGLFGRGRQR